MTQNAAGAVNAPPGNISSTADVQSALTNIGQNPITTSTGTGQGLSNAQSSIQNFNNQSANGTPRKRASAKQSDNTSLGTPDNPPDKADDLKTQDKNNPVSGAIEGVNNFAASFNVTRGLALAFFVLIFLIWMLIPTASGYTRLQLLWFTIMGQTKLTTDNNLIKDSPAPETSSGPGPNTDGPESDPINKAQMMNPTVEIADLDFSGFEI